LILDTKVETMSYLLSLDIQVPIHLLHPLDERSKAWDIAKDCRTPAAIEQLVTNLVPEEKSSNNRFFTDATRELMRGAIQFLASQGDSWTLRDLLLLLSNLDDLKLALAKSPSTSMVLQVLGDDITARNVFATLTTVIRRYETVAAAWATAKERISVADWVNSDSILVLGLHEQLRHPLSNIYRVFLQLVTEALLDKPETPDVQTFVILDEVRHMGKLAGVRSLCTNGRSRGTSVTLGFQDIEGMREVFGANEANELVGQCGSVALLRIQSPATADYASALLGSADWREYHISRSKQGSTTSEQVVTRPLILPGQFMGMPIAGPQNGTPGVFASMNIGVWTCSISSTEIFPAGGKPRDPSKNFWPRPISAQTIVAWTLAEIAKLGLQRTQLPLSAAGAEQVTKKLTFVGKRKPRV
jgi:type IV secretory pathway TraG/TraD family ATPase VirD4